MNRNERKQQNFLARTFVLDVEKLEFDFLGTMEEKIKTPGIKNPLVKTRFGLTKRYSGVIFHLNNNNQYEAKFYNYVDNVIHYSGFYTEVYKRVFTKRDDFIVTDPSLIQKIKKCISFYNITDEDRMNLRQFVFFEMNA